MGSKPTKFMNGLKMKKVGKEVRLYAAVEDLYEDPVNARLHDDKNKEAIRGSLKEFGQQKPLVVDRKGKVLAGNGRLVVAKAEGDKHLWVTVSDLTGLEQIAFALADNRTGELSEWDFDALSKNALAVVESGGRNKLVGWSDHDLEILLGQDFSPPEVDDDIPPEKAKSMTVVFNPDQWKTIESVVAYVREREGDDSIPDGGAVMLVLEEWEESLAPADAGAKGT